AARRALMLAAVLPAYFFFGFFMSPDAPATACWAAGVYFAYRALVREDARAWLGLGAALGLGMISKYTIALLAIAVVLFVLLDRRSRRWLAKPQPYAGALVALVLFAPVVAWNWQHDWISFSFQSRGRIESGFAFSVHRFLGNILGLVTPTGIVSVVALALAAWRMRRDPIDERSRAAARLLGWLALFPLAVFAAASLFRVSKLNWTGPVWLALLPYLAMIATPGGASRSRLLAACRRAWPPTVLACLLLYGGMLHWLGPGLPRAGYPRDLHLIGWRDFGADVERLVERLRARTGRDILVVGMDRNRIASGLAFYRTRYRDAAGIREGTAPAFDTASESLFDEVGLMYELWFPNEREEGRTLLLVAKDRSVLEEPRVLAHARPAGEILELPVTKAGKPAGRYYARLFEDYRAEAREAAR
ncbi:MAG TPA: glycosyltransferase family 39 protein, partial [Usitatibacter sp.]